MSEQGRPTGFVTFLFTDIEGSTKRWERVPAAMATAVARHDRLLRGAIEASGGYVFKTIGDAFCAAFQTPTAGLDAALAGQRALAGDDWSAIDGLRVRMALHTGQAEERDADYFGPTVNRVARLLSAGHGGQVLLSEATQDAVVGELPAEATLRDLGERRLKDLTQPERIFQLVIAGLPDAFPPLASLDARPNNLPVQPTPLLGREAELAETKARLRKAGTRVVTLTGPGGTGKTRLALQVTADLIDDYAHGVWFIDLGATSDPSLVITEIARALDVREEGGAPLEQQLREHLRDQELLLLLDNFEQVLPAAKSVASLLGAAPRLTLLVTSRAPLRIAGEQEYPVPPLPVPDPRRLPDAAHLEAFPSVELFVARAAAVKPGFTLSTENARAVAEICVALDGLPLAIELAAARTRMLSPQAMLPRLADRLKLLTGGGRDRAERQQTLRGAIAWSHDLLRSEEQALFARLAVFAGGCTFEAVEAVCNADGGLDVFEGIGQLVEHSLVRQEEHADGEPRFRMLVTIREFAADQLDSTDEAAAVREVHGGYFLALAEQAEPELTGPEQVTWLDRLETEHDNLRAAIGWCLEQAEPAFPLRITNALSRFWAMHGHLSEGRGWLERALVLADAADPVLRARVLKGAGALARFQGDRDVARDFFERALMEYRAAGDQQGVAQALGNLGSVAVDTGQYDQAASLFEQSLALFRDLRDQQAVGSALNWLGAVAFLGGEYDRATTYYEESLALSQQLRNTQGIALALVNLAEAQQFQGDLERAEALYQQALPLFRKLGDTLHAAFALQGLGQIALDNGVIENAKGLFAESLTVYQELGDKVAVAGCLESLAQVAIMQGDFDQGASVFGAAAALREVIDAPRMATYAANYQRHVDMARSKMGQERFESAWEAGRQLSLEQAISEASRLNNRARTEFAEQSAAFR